MENTTEDIIKMNIDTVLTDEEGNIIEITTPSPEKVKDVFDF